MSASQPRALALLLLAAAACTPAPQPQTGAGAGTTGTSTTTDTSTTTGTSTTTSSTATTDLPTTDVSSSPFIVPHDGGGSECSQWLENCPEGQKCMPYSNDGDNSWDLLKCVDIVPDPDDIGEPCSLFGPPASGEDSCDKHMMCWNPDPDTGLGTCVPMCIGSEDAPECADPDAACPIYGSGVITLCFPQCDPLAQGCPDGQLCLPYADGPFLCVISPNIAGQLFDPCEYFNACDPGLHCADPQLAHECDPMSIGCCLPFCDLLIMPNTCPGQDQQCLPWYEPGQAPPGHEQVGHCALP